MYIPFIFVRVSIEGASNGIFVAHNDVVKGA